MNNSSLYLEFRLIKIEKRVRFLKCFNSTFFQIYNKPYDSSHHRSVKKNFQSKAKNKHDYTNPMKSHVECKERVDNTQTLQSSRLYHFFLAAQLIL